MMLDLGMDRIQVDPFSSGTDLVGSVGISQSRLRLPVLICTRTSELVSLVRSSGVRCLIFLPSNGDEQI